jgi:PTS system nitrogen regulatory IIA component
VEQYLTVKEVAEMVRLTVQTIRRYTWKNEIPHHKINRAVRYKKSEVEQWVEKRVAASAKGQGGLFNETESGVHIL